MSAKNFIVGNWKMHGDPESATRLSAAVAASPLPEEADVVLCPPAAFFAEVRAALSGSGVAMGGQDCSGAAEGAFTGDISATMLKTAGCDYVIVGHSERRSHHGETNETVKQKAQAAIAAGLVPIICIGETAAERQSGNAETVVGAQLAASLPATAAEGNFILAYEPVWAIGSGQTPTVGDVETMHAHILAVAAKQTGLSKPQISVLYGGSVKAANAAELLAAAGVSGVLVGGASLKAEEFCAIAAAAAKKG